MSSINLPKVSIIIPVYNGAEYLKEAIDSAINQDYENIEVIVVNDGSCDDGKTREIALSYGEKIEYYEKENGGVSSALNFGIRHMTGEYFSWLSHDDKYQPQKISNSLKYLLSLDNRRNLIVMCGESYINERSEEIGHAKRILKKDVVYSGMEMIEQILTKGMLNMCCMLIPRKAFDVCGSFNEDLRYNQDMHMLFNLFCGGYDMVADHESVDVMYRLHATQTSKTRRDLLLRDSYALSKIIASKFALLSTKEANLIKMFALRNARVDCKDAVNECVRVGKDAAVLSRSDMLQIKLWCFLGKCRNVLKTVYHKLLIK